jgi:hypothetical protein
VLDDPAADRNALARNLSEFTVAGTRATLGSLLGKSKRARGTAQKG